MKQKHTGRRGFNRLVAEHCFTGGESTLRRYVKQTRIELGLDLSCQVFIPCEPNAGREAEVDWGQATAVIAGEPLQEIDYPFPTRSTASPPHSSSSKNFSTTCGSNCLPAPARICWQT